MNLTSLRSENPGPDSGPDTPCPPPWRVAWDGVTVEAGSGTHFTPVAFCFTHSRSRAHAALIVEAVNLHSALVAAVRDLMDPQNFRADPTPQTLRRRDEALLNAAYVLSRLAKRDG